MHMENNLTSSCQEQEICATRRGFFIDTLALRHSCSSLADVLNFFMNPNHYVTIIWSAEIAIGSPEKCLFVIFKYDTIYCKKNWCWIEFCASYPKIDLFLKLNLRTFACSMRNVLILSRFGFQNQNQNIFFKQYPQKLSRFGMFQDNVITYYFWRHFRAVIDAWYLSRFFANVHKTDTLAAPSKLPVTF